MLFYLCLDLRISQSVDNNQLTKTELPHRGQFDVTIEGRQQSFETHVIGLFNLIVEIALFAMHVAQTVTTNNMVIPPL